MSQDALSGPDLAGVVRDADAAGLAYVVIGGFSVIANEGAEHLRVATRNGIVDILRGGLPPLDFDTVAEHALRVEVGGREARVAGLRSIVGFKRLADRPRDRNDLAELEALHGELPVEPIPGLDG
jgi:hypothetical protein